MSDDGADLSTAVDVEVVKRRLFLTAALLGAASAVPALAQAPREITIGLSSASTVAAAPRVAQELGLFEKRGLAPKFVVLENTSAATAAILSKSVDVALVGPGDVVAAQARGQSVVFLAGAYSGFGGSLVLAKSVVDKLGLSASAPVRDRLKALDGLLLGTASATSPYTVALRSATRTVAASPRFAYLGVPGMAAAMESGAIQGFIVSASFWVPPVLKGSAVLWLDGPRGDLPRDSTPVLTLGVAALRDWAQAQAAVAQELRGVMADLSRAIGDRPADVKAAALRLFPNVERSALELMLQAEMPAWRGRALTVRDMAHDLDFVKSIGAPIAGIDRIEPAAMLAP